MSSDLAELEGLADAAVGNLIANPPGSFPDPDAPSESALGKSLIGGLGASPEARKRMVEINPSRLVSDGPVTAKTFSDIPRVREASDDIESMWMIERVLRETGDRFVRGNFSRQLGKLGAEALFADEDDPVREFEIRKLQERIGDSRDFGIPDEGISGFFLNAPGVTAEALPHMAESVFAGMQGAAVGALGGALVGQSTAGAKVGSTMALLFATGRAEAGHAFLELREITDVNGEKIDRDSARALSVAVGGINAVFEAVGLKALPGSGRLIGVFTRKGAREVLAKPVLRNLLSAVSKSSIKGLVTEGTTETLQELTSVGFNIFGQMIQGKGLEDFTHSVADPVTGETVDLKGSEAVWARVLEAMRGGAQAGLLLGGGGRAGEIIANSQIVQSSVDSARKIVTLTKAAEKSSLRESDPEAFKEHIRQSAEEGDGIDQVLIKQDAVREFFAEADAEVAQEILDSVGSLRSQAGEAALTGGDFVVSMEDYLAHIAPSPMGEAVADHTRLSAEEMTAAEIEEFRESLPDEMAQAVEQDREIDQQPADVPRGTITEEASHAELSAQLDAELATLVTEDRDLSAQIGFPVTPIAVARQEVKRIVGGTKIRHLDPHRYRLTAAKEGRLALETAAEGDLSQSQVHKRRQLMNTLLESSARRAREISRAETNYLSRVQTRKRLSRIGKAGADYREQVDTLLARFDLNVSRTLTQIDRRKSLSQWIVEREDAGDEVVIGDKLRNEAFTKSWKELTVDEMSELTSAIKNIEHLAKLKTDLSTARGERDMDEVRQELADVAFSNVSTIKESLNENKDLFESMKANFLSAESALIKMEFVIKELDGQKGFGVWRDTIWRPIADSEADRNDLSREYTEKFTESLRKLFKGKEAEYAEKKFRPLLGKRLSRGDLLAAYLNLGNESNKFKLLEGKGWTEASLMTEINSELSLEDMQFAQDQWDLIGTLWPRIAEETLKRTGLVPENIEASEVHTRFGVFKGGYFPVVYDQDKATFAERNADRDRLFDTRENLFAKPMIGHGFTFERTKVVGPILLDIGIIPNHLNQVIHLLTQQEAVTKVDRLLDSPIIKEALDQTIGPDEAKLFRLWLDGIAKDHAFDNRSLSGMSKLMKTARSNVTTNTLGGRPTTLLMQPLGIFNAIAEFREQLPNWRKHYASGFKQAYAGLDPRRMKAKFDEVAKISGEMRNRIRQNDKDQRDAIRRTQGKTTIGSKAIRQSMELIGGVQMFGVDLPIFLGAYEGAVAEFGMTHDQAVDFAEGMVTRSQGGAGAKDLSAIQRGDEGFRQLLLFFSWRNTAYNQLRGQARTVHQRKTLDAANEALVGTFLRMVLPAIGAATIHGKLFEGDEEGFLDVANRFFWLTLYEIVGTLPLVSFGPFGNDSPLQRIVEDGEDLIDPRDMTDVVFDLVALAGTLSGAPIGWLTRKIEKEIRDDD